MGCAFPPSFPSALGGETDLRNEDSQLVEVVADGLGLARIEVSIASRWYFGGDAHLLREMGEER